MQEDYEAVLSFLDALAENAEPGQRKALNPIVIGGSAKLIAANFRAAIERGKLGFRLKLDGIDEYEIP